MTQGRPVKYPGGWYERSIAITPSADAAADRLQHVVVVHKQAKMSKAAIYRAAVELLSQVAEMRPAEVADQLLRLDDPIKHGASGGKVT